MAGPYHGLEGGIASRAHRNNQHSYDCATSDRSGP